MKPFEQVSEPDAIGCYTTNLEEAVRDARLIVIATPVGVMRTLAEQFINFAPQDVLITDVGSVKGYVHKHLGTFLKENEIDFIGSHPMAGSEKQGIRYASADLFEKVRVVLTNDNKIDGERVSRLLGFWNSLGAQGFQLDAKKHDNLVAAVSHLPHAVAALCVHSAVSNTNEDSLSVLASTGFRDTTRVASGPPSMWSEILLENKEALLVSLNELEGQVVGLKNMLEEGKADQLTNWLWRAKEQRETILGCDNDNPEKFPRGS